MIRLSATLSLHGAIVEDRLLPVRDVVRLGEVDGAALSFPGGSVTVRRRGSRLVVDGRSLGEGEEVVLAVGDVLLRLEHAGDAAAAPPLGAPFADLRLLVATAALVLLGTAAEVARIVLRDTPEVTEVALRVVPGLEAPRAARLHGRQDAPPRDQPRATPSPAEPSPDVRWPPATFDARTADPSPEGE